MKIELQRSEARMLIEALRLLRAHYGKAASISKDTYNAKQKYTVLLVDRLQKRMEELLEEKKK